MTKREVESRLQFIERVKRESVSPDSYRLAGLLLRHGVTYARLQEQACNGVGAVAGETAATFESRQARFEARRVKRESQIEARVKAIAEALGFGVTFQGDPRGHCILLQVPSGYTNDWAKTGVEVPTS